MPNEKVEAIEGVSKSLQKKSVNEADSLEPNKDHFNSLMAQDAPIKAPPPPVVPEKIEAVSKLSPMDELKKLNSKVEAISKSSPEEIRMKADQIVAEIDQINKKFHAHSETTIAPSYNTLLKNRLSHIDDTLKIALSKAGLEHSSPVAAAGVNPIEKFLGYLSHGQHQLENLGQSITHLQSKGLNITPVDMLTIQVKINQIQQELEFFTNVLNKALESTKTLMNVQV